MKAMIGEIHHLDTQIHEYLFIQGELEVLGVVFGVLRDSAEEFF